jgi:hypothetical protein
MMLLFHVRIIGISWVYVYCRFKMCTVECAAQSLYLRQLACGRVINAALSLPRGAASSFYG